MKIHYFDSNYFNLNYKGYSTTTWTWKNLEKISHNGIVSLLDFDIDLKTKVARRFIMIKSDEILNIGNNIIKLETKIYTGENYNLMEDDNMTQLKAV